MERMRLELTAFDRCVSRASDVLSSGGVILYPTDTLYGLGADAFSNVAVDKIYAIKERDEKKPIHCVVANMAMASEYAIISDDARMLAKQFWPGALTLILKKKVGVDSGIERGIQTVGMRKPQHVFCLALARNLGKPFTATSGNIAGQPPLYSVDKILEQLGTAAENIDLAIDAGELPFSQPSTVVDLSGTEPVILREGAVLAADVWNAIRTERDN